MAVTIQIRGRVNQTSRIVGTLGKRVVLGAVVLPSGGITDKEYVHTQSSPATVWTVAHNLSKRPGVTVVDHLDREIYADVSYVDDNIIQVTHGTAIIGKVYCN